MNIWDALENHDTRVDLTNGIKEISFSELTRYGQWTPNYKNGRYLVPDLLSGSDYSGTLVQQSNYKAFEDTFVDGASKWWESVLGGHGTFAIVIDCENVPDNVAQSVIDFLNDIQNYPIADDALHSQMEIDAQIEAWNNWAKRDFVKAIENKFEEFNETPDESLLFDIFNGAQKTAEEYWINESGDSMYINIRRLVDRGITTQDFKKLQLSTISHKDALIRMQKAEHQVESLKEAVLKVHGKNEEALVAVEQLNSLLDAFNIGAIDWEICKTTGRLPDGRYIRFQ